MLHELENTPKVVGVKQVRRALLNGRATRVYLARDADPQLAQPLERQARERGVDITWAESMKALGRACGIAVGAACGAVVSSTDGAERGQKSKAH